MKKFATMAICFVLIACMVAGGSLAYLTDRDSEANVFTVGDVRIDLTEDFKDGSKLVPGAKIEKAATIKNIGDNDAYVWMTIAVPAALDTVGNASANVIHWNVPGAFWERYHGEQKYIDSAIKNGYLPEGSAGVDVTKTWNVDDKVGVAENVEHEGVKYNVYTLLYNSAIEPGEETNIGLSEVYMDAAIDIDTDGNWYHVKAGKVTPIYVDETTQDIWNSNDDGAPVIYVSAYGIQADGFEDVTENGTTKKAVEFAYEAYNGQWDNPNTTDVNEGTEWGPLTTPVDSVEGLTEVLENGGNIRLEESITSTEEPITIDENTTAAIDLNNNTLTGTISNNGGDVVVSGGKIEQSGDNVLYNEGNAEVTDVTASMTESTGYITNSRNDDSVTVFNNVNLTSTGGGVNVWQGEAVFNSGIITTNSTSTSARHVFYIADGAKLTINDGEFTFNPTNLTRKGSYICAQVNAEVIVNGGTFHQPSTRTAPIQALDGATVTIYGGTFAFDPSAFVADGYEAVQGSDGYWTVSAE